MLCIEWWGQFSWKTSRQNLFFLPIRLRARPWRACDPSPDGHFSTLTASLETYDKYLLMNLCGKAATVSDSHCKVWKLWTRPKMLSHPAVRLGSLHGMPLHDGPWEVSADSLPRTLHNTWLRLLNSMQACAILSFEPIFDILTLNHSWRNVRSQFFAPQQSAN